MRRCGGAKVRRYGGAKVRSSQPRLKLCRFWLYMRRAGHWVCLVKCVFVCFFYTITLKAPVLVGFFDYCMSIAVEV